MKRNLHGATGAWFSLGNGTLEPGDPITLVTLQLDGATDDAALQFLENAERDALIGWAAQGKVLMALVSHNRLELNLILACDVVDARIRAEEFPSVASEIAQVTVRGVTALSLTGQRKLVTH